MRHSAPAPSPPPRVVRSGSSCAFRAELYRLSRVEDAVRRDGDRVAWLGVGLGVGSGSGSGLGLGLGSGSGSGFGSGS
eukprot:scaffold71284_cov27-Phaeocystis_antarctica.AAC.1